MRPYLRAANVTWTGLDLSDVNEMNFEPTEAQAYALQPGDVLLNEASGSPNEVGKPAVWRGEIPGCCFQNTLLRVHTLGPLTDYLYWYFRYAAMEGRFGEAGRGVNIRHLGKAGLAAFHVPIAPLTEQARVVAAIDEHISRLEAAEALLRRGAARLRALRSKVEESVLPRAPGVPLGSIAVEARYGTSEKCAYDGAGPPVIRIPNVVRGRVELADLKFAVDPRAVSEDVMLRRGDLLFVRTNGSRDLIGRAAVAEGTSGLAFASYLIRFRLAPEVDPQYVSAVVSAPSKRRELEAMAATTAGQYNLSIGKLSSLMIPLPPLEEQRRAVKAYSEASDQLDRLHHTLDHATKRSVVLRRSVLAAAFSGRLVPQDPNDERASVLLDRIGAEQEPARPKRRKKGTA